MSLISCICFAKLKKLPHMLKVLNSLSERKKKTYISRNKRKEQGRGLACCAYSRRQHYARREVAGRTEFHLHTSMSTLTSTLKRRLIPARQITTSIFFFVSHLLLFTKRRYNSLCAARFSKTPTCWETLDSSLNRDLFDKRLASH
uniref:Uncharacterized protein n=1 Tax=Rhipicephalus zambeziensis TaxID=60191 RepID=A0A224YFT0_9ACAR